jgi:hypothetical protein
MTAKHKLNGAHFLGAIVIALVTYGLTGSIWIGMIAFVGLLVAGVAAGDIRL